MARDRTDDPAVELADEIKQKRGTGEASHATLTVDQRVLARITDGIYRRPSSAFRELISNAYDADARTVVIYTDAPRFNRITIRDDGNGMSPEILSDLVYHIGGSSKRTDRGKSLETVNPEDAELSPGGRRLIGKIGIGLFSVSQLTQHLQVITKRKGDSYRTSADIVLSTYTEELLKDAGEEFKTGDVIITSEQTSEPDAHGTEIILMDLRAQAKDILRNRERWDAVAESAETGGQIVAPRYHIGRVVREAPDTYEAEPFPPWLPTDNPEEKFHRLFAAVGDEVKTSRSNPTLDDALDNYLATLWRLSLAVPVRYIDKHPFDLTGADGIGLYQFSDRPRGQPEAVIPENSSTLGHQLDLQSARRDPLGGFRVLIDDVELLRPIRLDRTLHSSNSSIDRPLMFAGRVKSRLGDAPATLGGGPLEFEAYIYWNSKIVPKDNNGILVRINNSSGVLFDNTFMDYQVSELTRLRQLTAEVFIIEGLDAALNIDRESFNFSHPHYQYLQRWVHAAIRQTTNRLKTLGKGALDQRRRTEAVQTVSELERHALAVWERQRGAEAEPPPDVMLLPAREKKRLQESRSRGSVVIPREALQINGSSRHLTKQEEGIIKALVTVLEAYRLLDDMSYAEQEQLVRDLAAVVLSSHRAS